jgi:hypothetical protein
MTDRNWIVRNRLSRTAFLPGAGPLKAVALCLLALLGCTRGPGRFEAPGVDPEAAAAEAIEIYDTNGNMALGQDELAKCPGILSKLSLYDQDGNGSVAEEEIARRLDDLLKGGTGGTTLIATVVYQGRPLGGATVVLEPEAYLGDEVQTAQGITSGAGSTGLGIPPECVPEHLRRIKSVHYGTFKVRITHPTISLPAKYNTETVLGYETEIGNPYVRFTLADK